MVKIGEKSQKFVEKDKWLLYSQFIYIYIQMFLNFVRTFHQLHSVSLPLYSLFSGEFLFPYHIYVQLQFQFFCVSVQTFLVTFLATKKQVKGQILRKWFTNGFLYVPLYFSSVFQTCTTSSQPIPYCIRDLSPDEFMAYLIQVHCAACVPILFQK